MALAVRTEAAADHAAVLDVHRAAFDRPDEARLVEALRRDGDTIPELCLVAEGDGALAGSLVCSRAVLEPSGAPVVALAPMAAVPARQHAGVGGALVRQALGLARTLPYAFVVVLGHAEYYPRFGFTPARGQGVAAPFDVPDEAWMALRLPAWTDGATGTVAYAPAFAEL